jgi:peptidylprolyl isomerase
VGASGTAPTSATPPPAATPPPTTPPPIPGALPAPSDVKAAPPDAEKTASGLASKVLEKGTGSTHPGPTDVVEVNYTGWTTDGRMFDSSVVRKQSIKFPLNQVIKGWTEGVQLMVKGEKRRFWIGGAPSGTLVFDVELVGIVEAPKTPTDVAAAPSGAKKTKSGIGYRVLKKGTGKEHPTAASTVEVHYSGWTTDGKMFDSSVTRGEPAMFRLGQVIKGWTEGVQLMVQGEKTRFWIPGSLAYGDTPTRPGAPSGMLVFDIELLSIK